METKDFKELWENPKEKERRSLSKKLESMYSNDWDSYFEEHVLKVYKDKVLQDEVMNLKDTTNNILLFAASEKGAIYSSPPKRTLEDSKDNTEQAMEAIRLYESDDATNMSLDMACELNEAAGNAGLWCRVDKKTGMMDLEVVPTSRVSAIQNASRPYETDVVVIQKPDESGWMVYTKKLAIDYDKDWNICEINEEGELVRRFEPGQDVPENVIQNRYGLIPFVITHARYPALRFWNTLMSAPLADKNISTALSMSHSAVKEKYQSWIQIYVKEPGESLKTSQFVTGPGEILEVGPQGEIGTIDLQADVLKDVQTEQAKVDLQLGLQGLSPDKVRGNSQASSGYALKITRESQEVYWSKLRRLWRLWENQLYKAFVAISAVEASKQHPESRLILNWSEIGIGEDANKVAELHERKIAMGTMSPVEAVAIERGVTREKAEEIVAQIQVDKARLATPNLFLDEVE